jgi:hypothetical protein
MSESIFEVSGTLNPLEADAARELAEGLADRILNLARDLDRHGLDGADRDRWAVLAETLKRVVAGEFAPHGERTAGLIYVELLTLIARGGGRFDALDRALGLDTPCNPDLDLVTSLWEGVAETWGRS